MAPLIGSCRSQDFPRSLMVDIDIFSGLLVPEAVHLLRRLMHRSHTFSGDVPDVINNSEQFGWHKVFLVRQSDGESIFGWSD